MSIASSMMSSASKASAFSTQSTQSHAVPPELSREDFESIMDDFLENYEVVGRKYRPALGGVGLTGAEKLAVLRSAVEEGVDGLGKEENRRRILEIEKENRGPVKEIRERVKGEEDEGDKWDVETILSRLYWLSAADPVATYTNTENHPATIRSRLIPRAGPDGTDPAPRSRRKVVEESESSGSETEMEEAKVTVARKKGETPEERKVRKAGVKEDRAVSLH
jgi:protein LTV1